MTLEALVKKAEAFPSRKLINGDSLQGLFVDESSPEKKFFLTEQGDFWYVQDDNAYQVAYDKREGLKKHPLPKENSLFAKSDQYNIETVLTGLEKISKKINNRSFLGDERSRFEEQLVRLATEEEAISLDKKLLDDAVKSYIPTTSSISPFGRYVGERNIVIKTEDKGNKRVWNRPLTKKDAYLIESVASVISGDSLKKTFDKELIPLRKKILSENKKSISSIANEIMSDYSISRNILVEGSIFNFLKDHGFGNGERAEEQMYNVKREKNHWQFFLNDDRPVHIDVVQGKSDHIYEREIEKKKKFVLPDYKGLYTSAKQSFTQAKDKIKNDFDNLKNKTSVMKNNLKDYVSDRVDSMKSHVRSKALPYALAGALLFSGGSFFLGHEYGMKENNVLLEERVQQRTQEKELNEPFKETIIPDEKTYVVQSGDCLWDIAKDYLEEKNDENNVHNELNENKDYSSLLDDSAILEQTNIIARENDKLTIDEYVLKNESGQSISKKENPHLIYPGDELRIPQEKILEEQKIIAYNDSSKKESSDKVGLGLGLAALVGAIAYSTQKKNTSSPSPSSSLTFPFLSSSANPSSSSPSPQSLSSPTPSSYLKVVYRKPLALPVHRANDYLGVLREVVSMKNNGSSLQSIIESHPGFRNNEDLKNAFNDYQGYVQSGMLNKPEIITRYDSRVASDDFKNRIVHEYRNGKDSLKKIRTNLKKEYAMDVSESTISRYARKELDVSTRKEAKTECLKK